MRMKRPLGTDMVTNRPEAHADANPHQSFLRRAADLYIDGFRSMTVGRSLWALILIKLALLFLVFKLFFFPDLLSRDYSTDDERADAVRSELIDRGNGSR